MEIMEMLQIGAKFIQNNSDDATSGLDAGNRNQSGECETGS